MFPASLNPFAVINSPIFPTPGITTKSMFKATGTRSWNVDIVIVWSVEQPEIVSQTFALLIFSRIVLPNK